jgi:Ni2+-binding GTPase involved in maturation of urease and hydrogenase
MKIAVVAGVAAGGKTMLIKGLLGTGGFPNTLVVKINCLSNDAAAKEMQGRSDFRLIVADIICPDHFYLDKFPEIVRAAAADGYDCLIIETAGLCTRCSPFFKGVPAVCVLPTGNITRTPRNIGPIVSTADIIVLTRPDLFSRSENRIFSGIVRRSNERAEIMSVNNLTREGSHEVAGALSSLDSFRDLNDLNRVFVNRFTPPRFICSYCLRREDVSAINV